MSAPKLEFRIRAEKSSSLILGTLKLVRPDGTAVVWGSVTSGIKGKQAVADCWTRDKGLLPASIYCLKPMVVMTGANKSDNFKAVGEFLHSIWPNNIWSKDGKKKRSGCAVHLDANFATSPGSAGCIVFTDKKEWEQFMVEMSNLLVAGVRECPLEVIYT